MLSKPFIPATLLCLAAISSPVSAVPIPTNSEAVTDASGILSGIIPDVLSGITSGTTSGIPSGIIPDTPSGIVPDIPLGIESVVPGLLPRDIGLDPSFLPEDLNNPDNTGNPSSDEPTGKTSGSDKSNSIIPFPIPTSSANPAGIFSGGRGCRLYFLGICL